MGMAFHQVMGLENMLHVKIELMYRADFMNTDTNLGKLKIALIIIGWEWSKIGVARFFMWYSKICCISEMF